MPRCVPWSCYTASAPDASGPTGPCVACWFVFSSDASFPMFSNSYQRLSFVFLSLPFSSLYFSLSFWKKEKNIKICFVLSDFLWCLDMGHAVVTDGFILVFFALIGAASVWDISVTISLAVSYRRRPAFVARVLARRRLQHLAAQPSHPYPADSLSLVFFPFLFFPPPVQFSAATAQPDVLRASCK